MAVDIKRTFYGWTDTQPIAAGQLVTVEGQALMGALEAGVEKVQPHDGKGAFVGFARFRQLAFGVNAKVEEMTTPSAAPYVVDSSKNNLIVGQVRVHSIPDVADFGIVLAPAVPIASQVSIDHVNGVFTFNVADKGKDIVLYYRYNMTVLEAKTTMYEAPVNYPDPNLAGQVGVGKGKGRIYTLHYDASIDWSVTVPTAKAGGLLGAGGVAIPGARVVSIPTAADPYLAVEFNF